nr:hypothetical protein GCM10017745_75240 [Saccharothrix mutabilis subsp. capreolus]
MSPDFWLGLSLSVPIGLAVNIATPYLASLLARGSSKLAIKRADQKSQIITEAAQLNSNVRSFYSFLLTSVLRTTYVGAIVGILTSLLGAISTASIHYGPIFRLLAQLCALAGAVLVLNIARNALTMVRAVNDLRRKAHIPL